MRTFLDTNVFLRFIDGNEGVIEFWKILVDGSKKHVVHNVVLSELVWVLGSRYKYGKKVISEYLLSLYKTDNIRWTNDCDLEKTIFWHGEGRAKYNDCLIASAMENGDTIISYDREFDRFDWIKRVEPEDLLKK
jgi:predicted nucleic acid-binding protein